MDSRRKSFKSSSLQKGICSSQATSFESALEQPILPDEILVKIDSCDPSKPPLIPVDGNNNNTLNQNKSHNRIHSKQCRIYPDPQSIHMHSMSSLKNVDEEEKETKEMILESQLGRARSIQRGSSTLLRRKTKSRLMDSPPLPTMAVTSGTELREMPSGSIRIKSGALGKSGPGEDDEDDSLDEDIPNEFKHSNFNFLTILQLISLVTILAAMVCTFLVLDLRTRSLSGLELWKWELLGFVIICGRLVSGCVIRIAVFFVERNFLLCKRVLYFVYGLRTAVQNSIWLSLVLLTWKLLLDEDLTGPPKTLHYVTKALLCLLIATLFHLVKTLLVKLLASSFHYSTYFERIQEALFHQYVIETLSGPPIIEIQRAKDEEEQLIADVRKFQTMGYRIPKGLNAAALSGSKFQNNSSRKKEEVSKGTISVEQLYKMSRKNVSAWSMKRLIRTVRYGTLTTLDEQIPGAAGYNEDESTTQIRSEHEANVAAKKIFVNVAKPGATYIYLSDLLRFMKREEALQTMCLFEGGEEKNRICKKSLKSWVIDAFRERKALALTLNDTKTAVNKLSHMANVIVVIIVFSLSLLILGIATTRFFVFLSSQALLAVFMFGNTLKTIFEAIIFLFVMHPFDVGDRCEVEGVQLIVEEMNIMTTIFLRADNLKITYPNSVLSTKPISNFYRSPDMGDVIDFCILVATPVEKLAMMKERIIKFIDNKKEHWYPNSRVVLRDVDDMNRLKVSIWLRHRVNFQNMGVRFERREAVVAEMIRVLRELDIEYRMLPLDVNLRNMPLVTSTRVPSTWSTLN
ncbi:mechanosensitive ion channel protein 5-like [Carex rostrata]